MPKKTTKTAHVMSILTKNGALPQDEDSPIDGGEIIIEDSNLAEDSSISKAVENGLLELLNQENQSTATDINSKNDKLLQSETSKDTTQNNISQILPQDNISEIGSQTFAETKNAAPIKKYGSEYIVVPPISNAPSYSAPPAPTENYGYPDNSEAPKHFNILKNVKEYAPEILFDPDEQDQFPDSYFTEKEKNKMSNYEVTRLHADNEDYVCINVVEEITAAMLDDVMHRFDLCKCEKCRADVMAIALNDLTPKYVGTYKGQLFVKLAGYEKQYSADVLASLTKACIHVKSSPRHD